MTQLLGKHKRMGRHKHIKKQMDTKHKPRLNTQKNILGPTKVIFLLVLFLDYKLLQFKIVTHPFDFDHF